MKNITVSVDDDLYRQVRIKAAELSTSVSALVKDYLRTITGQTTETEFQRLEREEKELREDIRIRQIGLNSTHNLRRDELHVRA